MPGNERSRLNPGHDWLLRNETAQPKRPETIDLAIDAWKQGEAALAAGHLPEARFWAERAARLGPNDSQVRFLLGLVLWRQGDPRCFAIFQKLVTVSDTLPAHRGLIAAATLVGDQHSQREAVDRLLGRFVLRYDADLMSLADAVAAGAGCAGWCGTDEIGHVTVVASTPVSFVLDGNAISPRRKPDGRFLLPRAWITAQTLSVAAGGRHLLGSPIDLERQRATEGFVEATEDGGLRGWAWSPANPETPVTLVLETPQGRQLPPLVIPTEPADYYNRDGLSSPRAFHVTSQDLAGHSGMLHLRDRWGRDLTGSPIDPGQWIASAAEAAHLLARGGTKPSKTISPLPSLLPIWADTPPPPRSLRQKTTNPRLGPAVVIPVYRGLDTSLLCIHRVLTTVPKNTALIVVDDASPEPALSAALDALADQRRIHLIRNPRNLGFPGSANAGMRAAADRDVVLLNSDALVPSGWLERLRAASHSAPDIGTVAPLSNDATILSYPRVGGLQPPPEGPMLDRIDRMAEKANGARVVDIPTSVGFCMYIRRPCLAETGYFREDVFAQGYGEENDFCLRARHLGWRHVAAPGIFVSHIGGQSFRAARDHLLHRNQAILEKLHPGYPALIARHIAEDPLAEARQRLDLARWRDLREPSASRASVILITHDEGGGVERQLGARCRALAAEGVRAIILRPTSDGGCRIERSLPEGNPWRDDFPNLTYRIPRDLPSLVSLLRPERPRHIELHHRLGHSSAILELATRLDIPLDIVVHDYAAICPRVTLVTTTHRYCGEPDTEQCEACVADLGSRLREDISVRALRQRTAAEFAAARQVIFPSADTEARFRRYVPQLRGVIRPWENDSDQAGLGNRWTAPLGGPRRWRIAVIGAIGTEKGYDIILACARDAARRNLPLEFIVIGYTHDDIRLMETGRVKITYRFAPEQATEEISAQKADIGFIPSIWPETWCFALSDAWASGLKTAVFDIGTQAERVKASGHGWVLPLALPITSINNTLISLAQTAN